ncbi:MAG: hypothetical protein HY550_02790 [Elusimicrobia bacterium]|nr:hypothetical protein [Elusimicrobiota bacterium]
MFVVTCIAPGTGQAYKDRWRRAWGLLACAFALRVFGNLFWEWLSTLLGLKVPAVSYGAPPWQIMAPIYLSWAVTLGIAIDAARLQSPGTGAPSTRKIAAFFLFAAFLVNVGPVLAVYSLLAFSRP